MTPNPSTAISLANQLGDYFGKSPIDPVTPIETYPVGLNPYSWPPCKHCGGNVNCEAYDPDTAAGLWTGGQR